MNRYSISETAILSPIRRFNWKTISIFRARKVWWRAKNQIWAYYTTNLIKAACSNAQDATKARYPRSRERMRNHYKCLSIPNLSSTQEAETAPLRVYRRQPSRLVILAWYSQQPRLRSTIDLSRCYIQTHRVSSNQQGLNHKWIIPGRWWSALNHRLPGGKK